MSGKRETILLILKVGTISCELLYSRILLWIVKLNDSRSSRFISQSSSNLHDNLISDNEQQLLALRLLFCIFQKYNFTHVTSSPYHLQSKGMERCRYELTASDKNQPIWQFTKHTSWRCIKLTPKRIFGTHQAGDQSTDFHEKSETEIFQTTAVYTRTDKQTQNKTYILTDISVSWQN